MEVGDFPEAMRRAIERLYLVVARTGGPDEVTMKDLRKGIASKELTPSVVKVLKEALAFMQEQAEPPQTGVDVVAQERKLDLPSSGSVTAKATVRVDLVESWERVNEPRHRPVRCRDDGQESRAQHARGSDRSAGVQSAPACTLKMGAHEKFYHWSVLEAGLYQVELWKDGAIIERSELNVPDLVAEVAVDKDLDIYVNGKLLGDYSDAQSMTGNFVTNRPDGTQGLRSAPFYLNK